MARFLMATVPYVGHVNQALPIAHGLLQRGHEVWWYTGKAHRTDVEAVGAHYVPMTRAPDFSEIGLDYMYPERLKVRGLAKLKFDLKHVFIDAGIGQFQDMQEILARFPADALVCERAFVGASAVYETGGPPWAAYSISILPFNSRDTAPVGLGLMPNSSPLGRVRNNFLNWACAEVLFRDVTEHANLVRAQLDLPPLTTSFFDAGVSPFLYIQGTSPSFEYPRSDLPPQVHFVGPFLPQVPHTFDAPNWWGDLEDGRPVVLVTQGTVATNPNDLILPTIEALADDDVLVVVTTAGQPVETLGAIPRNVRAESYLPYYDLMPHVDVLVTNGGYSTVQVALAHGVPIVAAGKSEEKAEVANRVAWAGVGINLRTQRPTPQQVHRAVRQVLQTGRYRLRAREVQSDFRCHDAAAEAVALLERLAETKQPVLRADDGGQQ